MKVFLGINATVLAMVPDTLGSMNTDAGLILNAFLSMLQMTNLMIED